MTLVCRARGGRERDSGGVRLCGPHAWGGLWELERKSLRYANVCSSILRYPPISTYIYINPHVEACVGLTDTTCLSCLHLPFGWGCVGAVWWTWVWGHGVRAQVPCSTLWRSMALRISWQGPRFPVRFCLCVCVRMSASVAARVSRACVPRSGRIAQWVCVCLHHTTHNTQHTTHNTDHTTHNTQHTTHNTHHTPHTTHHTPHTTHHTPNATRHPHAHASYRMATRTLVTGLRYQCICRLYSSFALTPPLALGSVVRISARQRRPRGGGGRA